MRWLATLLPILAATAAVPAQAENAAGPAVPRVTQLVVFGQAPTFVSINDRRMITGSFFEPDPSGEGGVVRGFVLWRRFLDPIDLFPDILSATLIGNNDHGETVGLLLRADGTGFGFRYSRGEVENVNLPGSHSTTPRDINNRGDMAGVTQFVPGGNHGYLLADDQVTLIDSPARENLPPNNFGINVLGLNDKREVVGCYEPAVAPGGPVWRGFVFRNGTHEIFEAPGAQATCMTAINNRGQIVGTYSLPGSSDRVHGFLLSKGRYTTIDIPNARQTFISSINDQGDIVGTYIDEAFAQHAFKSNIREFRSRR